MEEYDMQPNNRQNYRHFEQKLKQLIAEGPTPLEACDNIVRLANEDHFEEATGSSEWFGEAFDLALSYVDTSLLVDDVTRSERLETIWNELWHCADVK